jgi:hypothetical protein
VETKNLTSSPATIEEQAFLAGFRAARGLTTSEPVPETKDWTKIQAVCPHCGKTKFVLPDFGVRNDRVRKRESRQPWCKQCRATTNYYKKPRKYKRRA